MAGQIMSTGVGSQSPDSDPLDSDPTDSDPDWSGEYVARVSRSRRRGRSQIDVERDERRIARGRGENLTIRIDDPSDATARACGIHTVGRETEGAGAHRG